MRALGPWAAGAIVVGTMVGTGIFLKPSEMVAVGGSVSVVYAAWIAGGILSLFGALSFAELGAALPKAGGQYAYLREGLGPVYGFLFGWMHRRSANRVRVHRGRLGTFHQLSCPCCRRADIHVENRGSIFTNAVQLCFYVCAAVCSGRARSLHVHQLPRREARWPRAGRVDGHQSRRRARHRRGGFRLQPLESRSLSSLVAGPYVIVDVSRPSSPRSPQRSGHMTDGKT